MCKMDFSELMGTLCPAGACSACAGCSTQLRSYVENADAYKNDPAIRKSEYSPAKAPLEVATVLYESWEAAYWTGGKLSKPTVITYYFSDKHADFHGNVSGVIYTSTGISYTWQEQWKEAIRLAAAVHNSASGIMLIEVDDPSKADITWRIEEMKEASGLGLVMAPGPTAFNGDIWVNAQYIDQLQKMDLMPGGQGFEFVIHEFGHAIGMNHLYAGRYVLPGVEFNRSVSIMTHEEDPTGLMHSLSAIDIGALSYVYGTNAQKLAAPVQWEQLSSGGLKSVGSNAGNTIVGIAGRDWEVGGAGSDKLNGGEGNDFLDPGLGQDIVLGGTGTDTLIVSVRMRALLQNPDSLIFRDNTMQAGDEAGKEGVFKSGSNTIAFTGIEKIQFLDGILDLRDKSWSVFKEADFANRAVKVITGVDASDIQLKTYAEAIQLGGSSEAEVLARILSDYQASRSPLSDIDFVKLIVQNSYGNLENNHFIEGLVKGLQQGIWTRDALALQFANSAELLGSEAVVASIMGDKSPRHEENTISVASERTYEGTSANDVFLVQNSGVVLGNGGHDQLFLSALRPDNISDIVKINAIETGGGKSGSLLLNGNTINFTSIEEIRFLNGSLNFNPDSISARLTRVFLTAVGHAPSDENLADFVRLVSTGSETIQSISQDLVRSSEFSKMYATIVGSTASEAVSLRGDFIKHIWQVALGREPTKIEMAQWQDILSNQGHAYTGHLIDVLTSSVEGKAHFNGVVAAGIWVQDQAGADISRIFHGIIGRLPLETELGPLVWNVVAGGESYVNVAKHLLDLTLSGVDSNLEFVKQISFQVLGHSVDQHTAETWGENISSGILNRAQFVLTLVNDPSHYGEWLNQVDAAKGAIAEAVTEIRLSSSQVYENDPGIIVGNLSWDQSSIGAVSYTIDDQRFEIADHGQIRLRQGVFLDHESASKITFTVTATDSSILHHKTTFVIDVLDVNEAPGALTLSGTSVRENDKGAVIGVLGWSDPDKNEVLRYSLSDNRFDVVDGKLVLKAGIALDFESQAAIPLSVTATDKGGLTTSRDFNIQVIDVNEAPGVLTLSGTSVRENDKGAVIGVLGWSDPDKNEVLRYSLSDSRFDVVDGKLVLKAGIALDFESQAAIPLSVTATDKGGLTTSRDFNIQVIDVNEAPGHINFDEFKTYSQVSGANVGLISVSDPDFGDMASVTVSDDRFEIISGLLKLRDGLSFNNIYDTIYQITIKAMDLSGFESERTVDFTVVGAQPAQYLQPGSRVAGFTLSDDFVAESLTVMSDIHRISSSSSGMLTVHLNSGEAISLGNEVKTLKIGDGEINFSGGSSPAQVMMMYEGLLGRSADKSGLNFWSGHLREGDLATSVAAAIMSSEEFQTRSGQLTDANFVKYLYNGILGRAADEGGIVSHLSALQHGATRESLVTNFVHSGEAINRFEGLNPNGVWTVDNDARSVHMLYDAVLNRTADESGFQTWTAALKNGWDLKSMTSSLLNSNEFKESHHGISDQEFISLIYHNALERSPDQAGFAFWSDKLATQSLLREDLAMIIGTSTEQAAQFDQHPISDIFGL
jgi:hypothetical protein